MVAQIIELDAELVDVLIGIGYGWHDCTAEMNDDPIAAVEWQRSTIDVIERSVMGGHYGAESA